MHSFLYLYSMKKKPCFAPLDFVFSSKSLYIHLFCPINKGHIFRIFCIFLCLSPFLCSPPLISPLPFPFSWLSCGIDLQAKCTMDATYLPENLVVVTLQGMAVGFSFEIFLKYLISSKERRVRIRVLKCLMGLCMGFKLIFFLAMNCAYVSLSICTV